MSSLPPLPEQPGQKTTKPMGPFLRPGVPLALPGEEAGPGRRAEGQAPLALGGSNRKAIRSGEVGGQSSKTKLCGVFIWFLCLP